MQFLFDGDRGYIEWGLAEPALPVENLRPIVHVAFASDGSLVGYEGTIAPKAPHVMKAALKLFGGKVIRKPSSRPLNLTPHA